MSVEQQKRILQLEAQLARCQNALEAARAQIAQMQQRAKNKAKKERR
jgi:signal transduction protein with GAF and PtsI domain